MAAAWLAGRARATRSRSEAAAADPGLRGQLVTETGRGRWGTAPPRPTAPPRGRHGPCRARCTTAGPAGNTRGRVRGRVSAAAMEGSGEGSLLQAQPYSPAAAGEGPLCAHLTWHLPQSRLTTVPASRTRPPPSHGRDLEALLSKHFLRILHGFRSFSPHLLTHRLRDVGPSSEPPLPSFHCIQTIP